MKKLTLDLKSIESEVAISDGYHTFDELYDHRITLYIALCKQLEEQDQMTLGEMRVWRSKIHSDGSNYEGWFILGINKEKNKQISYHIPLERWDETNFADTFDKAPCEFDGHTATDVLGRIKQL